MNGTGAKDHICHGAHHYGQRVPPGRGVSTLAANLAVVLAQRGQRVGLVDACISAPTQQMLFDISDSALSPTFNDFLVGRCDLVDTARALPQDTLLLKQGELFLVPADSDWGNPTRTPGAVWCRSIGSGFLRLADALRLNSLVIDSEGDLGESVLASMAMSDHVLAVVQLDQQYYKGLGVALGLAGQLDIPHKSLVVNLASPSFEPETVRQTIEQRYGWSVAGIVPYCDELQPSAALRFSSYATPTIQSPRSSGKSPIRSSFSCRGRPYIQDRRRLPAPLGKKEGGRCPSAPLPPILRTGEPGSGGFEEARKVHPPPPLAQESDFRLPTDPGELNACKYGPDRRERPSRRWPRGLPHVDTPWPRWLPRCCALSASSPSSTAISSTVIDPWQISLRRSGPKGSGNMVAAKGEIPSTVSRLSTSSCRLSYWLILPRLAVHILWRSADDGVGWKPPMSPAARKPFSHVRHGPLSEDPERNPYPRYLELAAGAWPRRSRS